MESVHPSKTGRNIESLNREIMGIARDAAFLYWLTDDEKYAKLAAGVLIPTCRASIIGMSPLT